MQSSAAVAVRAIVMLACLVGVPMAALSGASWSDMLEKLQNFQKSHLPAIFNSESTTTSSITPLPSNAPPSFSPSEVVETRPATPAPLSQTMATAVVPVGFQSPVEPTPLMSSAVSPDAPNVPGAFDPDADPCVSIQERLRRLGATYYLLESWGNDRQMYHFYCKIAIDGNADYTRCFEATDADPLQAMSRVMQQVEDGTEGGRRKGEGGKQRCPMASG